MSHFQEYYDALECAGPKLKELVLDRAACSSLSDGLIRSRRKNSRRTATRRGRAKTVKKKLLSSIVAGKRAEVKEELCQK